MAEVILIDPWMFFARDVWGAEKFTVAGRRVTSFWGSMGYPFGPGTGWHVTLCFPLFRDQHRKKHGDHEKNNKHVGHIITHSFG